MNIPATVSGRAVTNRGVHLLPFGFHGGWVGKAGWWTDLMASMGISWAVVCVEGDSGTCPQPDAGGLSVVQILLNAGIMPVVRYQLKLNYPFPNVPNVEVLVQQCAEYGVRPVTLLGNEPGNDREWAKGKAPRDWFERYCAWFARHAPDVIRAGAIAGFADGPCYDNDPFPLMQNTWAAWENGDCVWAAHNYGEGHPPGYPYIPEVQGPNPPLVDDAYLRAWYGPFYGDPGFNDRAPEVINNARQAGLRPGLTAFDDPVCWRGYERPQAWMKAHFSRSLDLCLTEGGWQPGASPDIRFPRPTPEVVARWTLEVMNDPTYPFIFQGHWLLADQLMGGAWAWNRDSWVNPVWRGIYPDDLMPVVKALQGAAPAPGPEGVVARARAAANAALGEIEAAMRVLG